MASLFHSWGQAQTEIYFREFFEQHRRPPHFLASDRGLMGVDGYVCRYKAHFVYWKVLSSGEIGIVTVLHQRMHQLERFRNDASL
jgi:toxin ParE1/3/4